MVDGSAKFRSLAEPWAATTSRPQWAGAWASKVDVAGMDQIEVTIRESDLQVAAALFGDLVKRRFKHHDLFVGRCQIAGMERLSQIACVRHAILAWRQRHPRPHSGGGLPTQASAAVDIATQISPRHIGDRK